MVNVVKMLQRSVIFKEVGYHRAVYGGCVGRKKAVDIQQIRTEWKNLYAGAVEIFKSNKGIILPLQGRSSVTGAMSPPSGQVQ